MGLRWTQEQGWDYCPTSLCEVSGSTQSGSNQSSGSGTSSSVTTPSNFQNPSFVNSSPLTATALDQIGTGATAGEGIETGLQGLSPTMFGNAATNATNNPLVAQTTGAQNTTLGEIGSVASALPGNLSGASSLLQSELSPNFASGLATSPQTLAAISSATQPMTTAFNTQTVPGLQGSFAQAGQRVGSATGTGSSAFDSAFGNAQASEIANEGAVAGSIANNAYQTGLNIQANAPGQAAALGSSEVGTLSSALGAQALPQATQQYGINQGLNK